MIRPTVYVGDVHAVVDELEECRRLVAGIASFAKASNADRVVFLGDQHHSMSTVRVEVLAFWKETFRFFQENGVAVTALVGNHDLSNDGRHHVMAAYPEVAVVDAPTCVAGVLYVPYVAGRAEFVRACAAAPQARTVVCHQLFDGSRYENGFYVGDEGVDPNEIPQQFVISGHIHKPQRFGKVWYPGAPRWRIASDANEDRAVWAVWHDELGAIVDSRPLDTAAFCRKIVQLHDVPEAPAAPPAPGPLLEVRVDVRGPADYVRTRAAELQAGGCLVKTFRTDAPVEVRESEGVGPAWGRFLGSFRPARGTPRGTVADLAARDYGLVAA